MGIVSINESPISQGKVGIVLSVSTHTGCIRAYDRT